MAQIIASLFATSREQVVQKAQRAAMAGADWLELRLDRWPRGESLAPVLAAVRLPVLVACRTPEEGGHFRGTLAEARELLTHALDSGAQGLDQDQAEAWSPPAGRTGLRLRIRSFHSYTGVPKELAAIRDRLLQHGGIAKIVVTAHDLADAAPVLDLLQSTDQREQPTIAFAMGRTAWPTRVLACAMGSPFVYGSIEPGEETAPGQLPVGMLRELYRVHSLGAATSIYGLLGNPALHSLGPWLHNRVFRRLGLDAIYLPFETSRPEQVVAMLPRRSLRGLSVTAPWKAAAAALCHHLADEAKAAAVVNTITAEAHGLLVGHNTDQAGVRSALARAGLGAGDGRVGVVLGTGGAARAGALALRELGCRVTMLGRSLEPVREFARLHGIRLGSLSVPLLDELAPAVVVQATPVGSLGRDQDERLVPAWRPRPGTYVLDMVYQPRLTRLLRDAAAAGAVVVPGVEMFLCQAQAQCKRFTGIELAVEELRSLLAGTAAGVAG
ncbi:MAG: type I 3-dehydroquinate dehydratase [Planctomycetes bacterium]|jgi:3-dehydroquinate dehydratase/shikimate dehydrogenase|nr:type I 3-dehydroquinate dehydratase [Planctomycetota bacterium]